MTKEDPKVSPRRIYPRENDLHEDLTLLGVDDVRIIGHAIVAEAANTLAALAGVERAEIDSDAAAVLRHIREHEGELRKREHLTLFGSVARGEAGPDGDVDLLIDLDPSRRDIGIRELAEIGHNLEDALGGKVDVGERGSLRNFARKSAERDGLDAF